ncbi:MAG: radical SAM protein [bacterium]
MNILFIQHPIQDFYNTRFREYPLGLLYLAAALKNNKELNVNILDARYCSKPKVIPVPSELKYLERYYTKSNELFLNYKHFGMSFDEIRSKIKGLRPDVVCINVMFTTYNAQALQTAAIVKEVCPNCMVIAGGYHATVASKELLSSGCIDVVVRGEGEEILARMLNNRNIERSKGTIVDSNGSPFIVDDLDSLSFPARELLDPTKYTFNKRPYTMLLTSRGCPNSCVFCSVHSMAGHGYRARDISKVLEEIDECYKKYGIEAFDLQDDNLLFDPQRMKRLLDGIMSKYGKKKFDLLASNGLNSSNLDPELLGLMKDAGFKKLDISLATGAVPYRDGLKRPETIVQYESLLESAVSMGFDVTTYVIIGLPEQPLDEIKQTLEYLMGKKTLISPSVFYNVPGMPIYNEMKKYERLDLDIARRSTAFNSRGRDFEPDDIFNVFRQIRRHNLNKQAFL